MSLAHDLSIGLRAIRNAPRFAATAILTMALGIGATTAVFSVAGGMLWKPLPLPHLDTLAVVLLVGAGLMLRAFGHFLNGSGAFQPETVLTLRLAITGSKYKDSRQVAGFCCTVLERINAVPGVRPTAAVSALPYSATGVNRGGAHGFWRGAESPPPVY